MQFLRLCETSGRELRRLRSVGHDAGSSLASQRPADVFGVGDEARLAAPLQVADDGLNLRAYAASVELIGVMQALGVADGDPVEPFLVRPVEVDRDALDAGGDEEEVGADGDGTQAESVLRPVLAVLALGDGPISAVSDKRNLDCTGSTASRSP